MLESMDTSQNKKRGDMKRSQLPVVLFAAMVFVGSLTGGCSETAGTQAPTRVAVQTPTQAWMPTCQQAVDDQASSYSQTSQLPVNQDIKDQAAAGCVYGTCSDFMKAGNMPDFSGASRLSPPETQRENAIYSLCRLAHDARQDKYANDKDASPF